MCVDSTSTLPSSPQRMHAVGAAELLPRRPGVHGGPGGCTGDHIEEYAAQGRWTALFNAIVLIASPLRPESTEQSMQDAQMRRQQWHLDGRRTLLVR
jgi:hypothetical protein